MRINVQLLNIVLKHSITTKYMNVHITNKEKHFMCYVRDQTNIINQILYVQQSQFGNYYVIL